jgi:hypothetical protein
MEKRLNDRRETEGSRGKCRPSATIATESSVSVSNRLPQAGESALRLPPRGWSFAREVADGTRRGMQMGRSNRIASLGGASLALAMALAATPAWAQPSTTAPDEPLEEASSASTASTASSQGDETIIVTGSRIRRNPLDQDQPVTFLDESDIARSGLTSAADIIQRLPSSGGALNSRFNNSGNFGNPPDGGGVGAGSAEVDLR